MAGGYTFFSDIFSIGVVYLELLTSLPAYDGSRVPPNLHSRMRPLLISPRLTEIADRNAGWNLDLPRLNRFADVILRCINMAGTNRPLITEVNMK